MGKGLKFADPFNLLLREEYQRHAIPKISLTLFLYLCLDFATC